MLSCVALVMIVSWTRHGCMCNLPSCPIGLIVLHVELGSRGVEYTTTDIAEIM